MFIAYTHVFVLMDALRDECICIYNVRASYAMCSNTAVLCITWALANVACMLHACIDDVN